MRFFFCQWWLVIFISEPSITNGVESFCQTASKVAPRETHLLVVTPVSESESEVAVLSDSLRPHGL